MAIEKMKQDGRFENFKLTEKINEIIDTLDSRHLLDDFMSVQVPVFMDKLQIMFDAVKTFEQRIENLEEKAFLKPSTAEKGTFEWAIIQLRAGRSITRKNSHSIFYYSLLGNFTEKIGEKEYTSSKWTLSVEDVQASDWETMP